MYPSIPHAAKTPTFAGSPGVRGAWPASSSAAHASSRNTRCCGSITAASARPMPQKAASNLSASSSNCPFLTKSGCASASAEMPLAASVSASKEERVSSPAHSTRQKSSRSSQPGSLPAIPITAISTGPECCPVLKSASSVSAGGAMAEREAMCEASSPTVACAYRSSTERASPSRALSAATSSAAEREWPPRSKKLSSGSTCFSFNCVAHTCASSVRVRASDAASNPPPVPSLCEAIPRSPSSKCCWPGLGNDFRSSLRFSEDMRGNPSLIST
mmetsp:Transcript_24945/g.63264  ORF Transcript_24945/g.63264 Transcript_24945/m.63264 type:complete len:274 (-) Transcript_24945:1540-2361(-)